MSSINSLTKLRLSGMSSGFDTDAVIKSLMQIQQLKIDRELRARTQIEWRQDALTGIKDELTTFKENFLSVLGKDSMVKDEAYNTYKVDLSGSNAEAVTVKGTIDASVGRTTIDQVMQLATGAKATAGAGISNGNGLDTNLTLIGLRSQLKTGTEFDENGQVSFKINNKTFTFKATDTLNSVMSTINGSGIGVKMSYSQASDRISIESMETGGNSKVDIQNISGNLFGGSLSGGGAFGITPGSYLGSDAIVKINGHEVTRSTNHFTVDGLEYTLNSATLASDAPIYANVSRDVSATVDKVKKFVEGYNTIISKLESMLVEKKSNEERKYTPLTDEEKEGMSEKQIEQWESIAKKGILRNDSGIQNLVSSLRSALYDSVSAAGLSPSQIGLGTGRYDEKTKGMIKLDEDRLRSALESDPKRVMNVFANLSKSTDAGTAYKENGMVFRIDNLMRQYISGSQSNSLENLERSYIDVSKRISTLQRKMEDEMERYYAKFAAMEKALSNIQAQSDWLAGQLAGLQ